MVELSFSHSLPDIEGRGNRTNQINERNSIRDTLLQRFFGMNQMVVNFNREIYNKGSSICLLTNINSVNWRFMAIESYMWNTFRTCGELIFKVSATPLGSTLQSNRHEYALSPKVDTTNGEN